MGVYGDPGVAEAVRRDVNGIGFNNVNYAYDAKTKRPIGGISPLPIDIDGDGKLSKEEDFYGSIESLLGAIRDGKYPSPPARDLNLVSKGVPGKAATKAFLLWILGDGQKYVPEAGFVNLAPDEIERQAKRLK